ncbi:stAR-related lipid transfer protein 6-like isoform X2 [Hemicordylus capensis]|uniref:stAR-related lipid transfer protein 6-like isoform X2 n=1 Tax=Hemicordylus capensis TaxID=884348 RepID=UPI002304656D|nr:stAR-related lipid transfer protein 6-like isoform X2 [Hemicordylus capensis]
MLLSHTAPNRWETGVAAVGKRRRCRRLEGMLRKKGKSREALARLPSQQICGPEDYRKIANEVSNKILMYVRDTSGWKELKRDKNVTVSAKPSNDFAGLIYRVEAVLDIPAAKVFPLVYVPEYRCKWDKGLQSYQLIDTIDKVIHITHSYGMGMISPRDFVVIVHIKRYGGEFLTTNSCSVYHPNYPPTSRYVRGNSFPCGYACYPMPGNPNQCMFMAILQVDLGGVLRPSLVDSVMPVSLINLITDIKTGIKTLKL